MIALAKKTKRKTGKKKPVGRPAGQSLVITEEPQAALSRLLKVTPKK